MAKKLNTVTTFEWSTDPAVKAGEIANAIDVLESMLLDTVRAASKAGYGRTDLYRAMDRPSSTVYHLMIRAGVHTPKAPAAKVTKAKTTKPAAKSSKASTKAKTTKKAATAPAAKARRTVKAKVGK